MKKALHTILRGILIGLIASLPLCFLASCQDLTGPQGERGEDGRDAVLPPDIGEAVASALAAKTGNGTADDPWIVKISGLDLSDTYTARHIFHGVAAGIPEGGIDLDLSECTGAFFGSNAGVSLRDRARYTGLTLPDSLISISDDHAFQNFTGLKRVSASGLLRAGTGAFSGCTALEDLDLPELGDIGNGAFRDTALTRVNLPKAETIGDYAFYNLAIAEINLPEAVSIGREAFAGSSTVPNTVLSEVNLPKAESLAISAFQYCNAIETINLPAANELLGYTFGADSASPNTVLKSVTLPEAATIAAAFENCTALKSADLPVAASFSYTFRNCTSLTTVSAPELVSVGDYVFDGCTSLVSLDLPKAKSIGASTFLGCTGLTTLTIPEVTGTGESAFDGCTGLTSLELTKVKSLGRMTFANCVNLTSLKLGPIVPTTDTTNTSAATYGIFLNTSGGDSTAITISVPTASLSAYNNADWQEYNTSETGWIDTAADGSAITWGTNHNRIIMVTY